MFCDDAGEAFAFWNRSATQARIGQSEVYSRWTICNLGCKNRSRDHPRRLIAWIREKTSVNSNGKASVDNAGTRGLR